MLLLRSQAATSGTFDSFLHALVTPRPDTTKTYRLFALAAKFATMTPCIDICTGLKLSLRELVAVSKYQHFLHLPMEEARKDFRIAFRRRCTDIDLFYSNGRLPPEDDFGFEIRAALLEPQFGKLLIQFNERILNYVLSNLRGSLTPLDKDTLSLLLLVICAINRTLPRTGIQKLQARPAPPLLFGPRPSRTLVYCTSRV